MGWFRKSTSTSAAALSFSVGSDDTKGRARRWKLLEVRCHASAVADYTIKIDSGLGAKFDTVLGTASTVTDYHYQPTYPVLLSSDDKIVVESTDAVDHGVEVIAERA